MTALASTGANIVQLIKLCLRALEVRTKKQRTWSDGEDDDDEDEEDDE
jgi:hypothetical protein